MPSRRSFFGAHELELARAGRQGGELSVAIFDVDGLAETNARAGHDTGDDVLRAVASVLAESVRLVDTVARYGGDEFLILLAETTSTGADIVVQRINAKLQEWNEAGQLEDFRVSLSIGVAEWRDGQTLDEVLDGADHKMYEQKDVAASARPV